VSLSPAILIAAALGLVLGFLADRLAARWPVHLDGRVRGMDIRTVAVTVSGGLAFGALAGRWSEPRDLAVLGIYTAALIVLLATDLDQKLLPDAITFPLMAYGLAILVLDWNPILAGKDLGLVSALGAAIGAPIVLLVTDRLLGGALGMGDVKLSVSLGLVAGISRLVGGFIVASALSAVLLIALIVLRRITLRTAIPFGPILIAGGIVAMLLPGG
jgi:leader peptidase (prepilin peptidase) / N-methyltransferase